MIRSGRRVFVPAKNVDGEWRLWWNLFNSNRSFFNNFTSVEGDLFDAPIHFALANCLSSDFKMSRGIARTFKLNYKGVEQQNQKLGGGGCLRFRGRKNVENATATNTNLLEIFELFKKNIIRRGPDSLGIEQLTCNNNQLLFAASVLWLQGSANTIQPLKSDNSLFIYNGDIFEGFTKKSNCTTSDTTILFELLNRTDNIPSELRKLQGPYAFVYLKNKDQLYFGRDPFGRKSLLLGRNGNMIILSSVARKTANFEFIELPSIGTFCWDLRTDELSVSANNSPNLHSKLSEVERFLQKKIVCNVASHSETLKFLEPSPHIANLYKELPIVEIGKAFSVILKDPDWLNKVIRLKILLEKSLYRRISTIPKYCKNCIGSQISCSHPLVGILFSGGIDCSILALLADKFIERSRPIDLFNVAFDEVNSFKTPDRQSGLETLEELRSCVLKGNGDLLR
ncbi:hypothetical protein JTB14_017982 [Gonioctena quinquepunctata]|nr:hypothetical protein JTB14_017982 [Gonioctena quinquepunctata]